MHADMSRRVCREVYFLRIPLYSAEVTVVSVAL